MAEGIAIENDHKLDDLAYYLSRKLNLPISRSDTQNALFILWCDKCGMEWEGDIYDIDLDLKEAFDELLSFDFSILHKEIESDPSCFLDILQIQRKVSIKSSGIKWIIHRYDADPFPSFPHAHCVDQNIKLDLSNGDCYRGRKYLKTIPKKELIKIRNVAMRRFKDQLPELVI